MVELSGLRVLLIAQSFFPLTHSNSMCEACDGTYNQLQICYCAEVDVDDVDMHLYCWYLMSDI